MVFKRQQQFEINWLWWEKEINPLYVVCFFSYPLLRFHFATSDVCASRFYTPSSETKFFYWFFLTRISFFAATRKILLCIRFDRESRTSFKSSFYTEFKFFINLVFRSVFMDFFLLQDTVSMRKVFVQFQLFTVILSISRDPFQRSLRTTCLDVFELNWSTAEAPFINSVALDKTL